VSSQRRNVLILDSDPEFLIALERVLEEEGFNTTTTWNTGEAIALLGSRQFHAVLLGEHPPEVNGEEILQALQSRRSIPCIVMLATIRNGSEAEHLSSLGAYAVIPKKRIKEVLDNLRQSLEGPHGACASAA
jgi:CheY-like chemotaxis protein